MDEPKAAATCKLFMFELGRNVHKYTHVPPCPPVLLGTFSLTGQACHPALSSKVCFPFMTHYTWQVSYDLFFFPGGVALLVLWLAMIISVCHHLQLSLEFHEIELISNSCARSLSQAATMLS